MLLELRMNPCAHLWARLSVSMLALVVVAACTSSDPALPVAPTGDTNAAADGSTLKVQGAAPQSPTGDEQLTSTPITLVASPASASFTQDIAFRYRFELRDTAGNLIQSSDTVHTPAWEVPVELAVGERYTWRVRAEFENGVGPWSLVASFITPVKPPSPCRHFNDPIGIIGCWMDILWGGDDPEPEDHYALNVAVAKELNRAGVEGGPFGILHKHVGNNCLGYSCDILCSGQGSGQRQYDYLISDSIPTWGSPKSGSQIRVDVCEIHWPD
jgi:hypothetical protein